MVGHFFWVRCHSGIFGGGGLAREGCEADVDVDGVDDLGYDSAVLGDDGVGGIGVVDIMQYK